MANAVPHPSVAERIGRFAGRAWRGGVRGQKRLALWLTSKGAPAPLASALTPVVAIVALVVLAYVAFWVAMLVVILVGAAWVNRSPAAEHPDLKWMDQDHRASVFYDPKNYNDDPDPRFEDD
nr:DUF3742 family protein [uncultured Caldimonas sp.]